MKPRYYMAVIWCLGMLVTAPALPQTTAPVKSPSAATAPAAKSAAPAQGSLVDINSATAVELDKLPGVGPARAQAIISHRPYSGKDDLARRKVVPQNLYEQIKDKIIARQGTAGAPSGSAKSPAAATKSK